MINRSEILRSIKDPLSVKAQADIDKLFLSSESLRASSRVSPFEKWRIAELVIALMLNRPVPNEDAVPKRLVEYVGYSWQRPSVQR
jgi:hypothetical protein